MARRAAMMRLASGLLLAGAGLGAACKGSYSDATWIVPPPPDVPPGPPAPPPSPSATAAASARPEAPPDPLVELPPPAPTPEVKPAPEEADDYAVYRAVLGLWHSGDKPLAMVIGEATSSFSLEKTLTGKLREELGITDEVINDYTAKSAAKRKLVNAFGVSVNVFVVTAAELDPIFDEPLSDELKEQYQRLYPGGRLPTVSRKDGWDRFHKRYPGTIGIISLSRVAYDKSRTTALAYTSHVRGSLAAAGVVFVFKKGPDGWVHAGAKRLWVS